MPSRPPPTLLEPHGDGLTIQVGPTVTPNETESGAEVSVRKWVGPAAAELCDTNAGGCGEDGVPPRSSSMQRGVTTTMIDEMHQKVVNSLQVRLVFFLALKRTIP